MKYFKHPKPQSFIQRTSTIVPSIGLFKIGTAVAGMLLYYARAVDSTILPVLSSLATKQAKQMQKTIEKVKQLLDYCATQEEAIITYSARKIMLSIHSNTGCCNKKNACS
jgi:hypothetical protein